MHSFDPIPNPNQEANPSLLCPPPPSFHHHLPSSIFSHEQRELNNNPSFSNKRKIPWRLSAPRKRRQRKRLKLVDNVVATLDRALAKRGMTLESIERWKREMPSEAEMLPRDKYTIFDRKVRGYRKGIHSMFFPSFYFFRPLGLASWLGFGIGSNECMYGLSG